MRSFKYYAIGAAIFAVAATIACVLSKETFFSSFDAFVLLPIFLAIVFSGNVHQPSDLGMYLGLFLNWFIVGLAVSGVFWFIRRAKKRVAT
jgi:hypothetical protein